MSVLQTATSYSLFLDICLFSGISGLFKLADSEPKVNIFPLDLISLIVYFIKNLFVLGIVTFLFKKILVLVNPINTFCF